MNVPAIVLLEFDSIAAGILAGDAMAKRAPLDSLRAGTVQPGKYLVLAAGEVADVQEAELAGLEAARHELVIVSSCPTSTPTSSPPSAASGAGRRAARWASSRPVPSRRPSRRPIGR